MLAWLRAGDGVVMIGHANAEVHQIHSPSSLGNTTVQMMVYVHDIDAHYAHAVAEGAVITMPVQDAATGSVATRQPIPRATGGTSRALRRHQSAQRKPSPTTPGWQVTQARAPGSSRRTTDVSAT